MNPLQFLAPLSLLALPVFPPASPSSFAATKYAGVRQISIEPSASREKRHERISERRARPIIIAHRGAGDMAPENSLEAYAMAMDYGADGCEIDLRRTRDGVLVLFHDDMLDRLLETVGDVGELTFAELSVARPRLNRNRVLPCHGPPTFAALLELARQRAMLLHLDIKEPGLENGIMALLDQTDAWDHIVSVNAYNATNILRHPKLKTLPYKTGLFEGRRDLDPKAVQAALPGPGEMIIVDDPRVAARAMSRPAHQPVPLPKDLCVPLPAETGSRPATSTRFSLHAHFQSLGDPSRERAMEILRTENPDAAQAGGDDSGSRRRAERIAERAWAARILGRGRKTARVVGLLERQLRQRGLHEDWRYHGLDGVMAARSLANLDAVESVPALVEAYRRVDPALQLISDPRWGDYPPAWRDARFKEELLRALGDLRSPASKTFLMECVDMDEARARELSPPQFADAAQALLRQTLTQAEMERLLRHPNPAVSGTVMLACLDEPTNSRTQALQAAAPWALELPPARPCQVARQPKSSPSVNP